MRGTRIRAAVGATAVALALAAPGAHAAITDGLANCDPLDRAACLLPFPNDRFTVADPTTPTGRRVHFSALAMPRNFAGVPIDPTDWNRADGFSPGSLIVTRVPGLDTPEALRRTGAVPDTDLARAYDPGAPVVVIDEDTGRRQLIWVEIDSTVPRADRTLLIRPAQNLLEGHRYVVALRNLKDAAGRPLEPTPEFTALRDAAPNADATQVARYDRIFAALQRAGIDRRELYLAWDFTVASERSLSGRMLAIRNDAFAQLGDHDLGDQRVEGRPPAYAVKGVADSPGAPIVREVSGTMTVPCYMDVPNCLPVHSQFVLGPDGLPRQPPGNTMQVKWTCRIPASATPGHPSRIALYGHGLFGSQSEIHQRQLQAFGNEHDITFCATDWTGMASDDVPNVLTILLDLSSFPTLADRVQQGMLNFLYLGRLMLHPDGLAANRYFQRDGHRLLDTSHLYYDGNSQGGIIGGALTAVAPDFTRATLGVPGMNYSTLLSRSSDFGTGETPDLTVALKGDIPFSYAYPLYQSYPRKVERQLIFSLMQMLWDRAEPDGYAQHMTSDPLPDTPAHRVMLHVAIGDHQVAPIAAEVEARTIGAHVLRRPAVAPGRSADVTPLFGITPFRRLPGHGSAIVLWDSGSPVAPTTNTPPDKRTHDPHEDPRNSPAARAMKSDFFAGSVVDTCGAKPCTAEPQK